MSGSKKGERRGAAGRRRRVHETVGEILDEVTDSKRKLRSFPTERRIEIARVIHGDTGRAVDMTMKEIMMKGARWHAQAVEDWERALARYASMPPTPETIAICERAEREIAHHLAQATDHAYKVAPYDHARLAAMIVRNDPGLNSRSIVDDLLDDIDQRMRENSGPLIEHDPIKRTG